MSYFGEKANIQNAAFGSVRTDRAGNSEQEGVWCYLQDLRVQIGLSQGNLQGACEQIWRFSVSEKNRRVRFQPGRNCQQVDCPFPEEFTISNEEFKFRNTVGRPLNYDTANNNLDWVTKLCKKNIVDDPGARNSWDFQYIADVRIEGCTVQDPENEITPKLFLPNPINPDNGKVANWKIDTDCAPWPLGPDDSDRREQLERFRDCFCRLESKLDSGQITRDQFDACFAAIIVEYLKALRLSYPDNYDPNDSDKYNEFDMRKFLAFAGCPDCAN